MDWGTLAQQRLQSGQPGPLMTLLSNLLASTAGPRSVYGEPVPPVRTIPVDSAPIGPLPQIVPGPTLPGPTANIGTIAGPGPLERALTGLLSRVGPPAANAAITSQATPTMPQVAPEPSGFLDTLKFLGQQLNRPMPRNAFAATLSPDANRMAQYGAGIMDTITQAPQLLATAAGALGNFLFSRGPVQAGAATPGPGTRPVPPSALPAAPAAPATPNTFTFGGAPQQDYFTKTRAVESSGVDSAKNPRSSATGRYQFIDSTWIGEVRRLFPELAAGKDKGDILALRANPQLQELVMRGFTAKNEETLRQAGLPVNDATRYMAHFLGAGGASSLLTADPSTPIKSIVGDAAYNANLRNGRFVYGETAGDVIQNIEKKFGTGDSGTAYPSAPTIGAPQLPSPPTLQAPAAINTAGYLATLESARPKPDAPDDGTQRFLTALAGMAAGAAGSDAKSLADVIAKAGAGASGAVQKDIYRAQERKDFKDRELRQFTQLLAGGQLNAAQIEAQNATNVSNTDNQNKLAVWQTASDQVKLDTTAAQQSALRAYENAKEKFVLALPKVSVTEGSGVVATQTDPNTGKVTLQTAGGSGTMPLLKQLEKVQDILGRNPMTEQAKYEIAREKGGGQAVQGLLARDLIRTGGWKDVMDQLGKGKADEFRKQVGEAVPQGSIGSAKYQERWDEVAESKMLGAIQANPQLLPIVLQALAKNGNVFALGLIGK